MAKKGKKHARSLSSRKKAKDMTSATPTWERFASDRHLAEPPKKDFDEMPRKMREMQKAIERMKQREAGGPFKPFYSHREDKPKPAPFKGQQQQQQSGQHSSSLPPSQQQQQQQSKHKRKQMQDAATPMPSADEFVPPRLGKTSLPSTANAAGTAAGVKRSREEPVDGDGTQRVQKPRFGETNDAPPTLVVGGQLSKKLAAARSLAAGEQAKAEALARQRQGAIDAYAKAKAARRADDQMERGR